MAKAEVKTNTNTEDTFRVTIRTPDSVVFQGRAKSISSRNNAGAFDILPEHANMITLIENQPIQIVTDAGTRKFTFEKAVIAVKDNSVSIYANINPSKTETEKLDKASNS